jgi:hypothetical protein
VIQLWNLSATIHTWACELSHKANGDSSAPGDETSDAQIFSYQISDEKQKDTLPPSSPPLPRKKKLKDKTKRRKIWNSFGLSPAYYAKNAH